MNYLDHGLGFLRFDPNAQVTSESDTPQFPTNAFVFPDGGNTKH